MIKLVLPFPIGVWDLYEGWGANRHRTREYDRWRHDAGWMIRGVTKPLCVPVSVHIALKRPNKRVDIDNFAKAICDVLQHYQVIKNDNLVERLTMVWHEGPEECVVLIQSAEEAIAA